MKTGWDPIDELDDDTPVPSWIETVCVVLFVLMTLTAVFLGF